MRFSDKKRFTITCVISAIALGAYLAGYLCVRNHHLSFQYLRRGLFRSTQEAEEWVANFPAERDSTPLGDYNNEWLFVFFWPAIQIDSLASGRQVSSPFSIIKPYRPPKTNTVSLESDEEATLKPKKVPEGVSESSHP